MLEELLKAGLSLLVGVVVLAAGWFIGQRIIYQWAMRQKRREFDLTAAAEFYRCYADFQSVRRLWSYLKGGRVKPHSNDTNATQWALLNRAAEAEAGVDAALLRLATEWRLSLDECVQLGKTRQAYQHLREAIRSDLPLEWGRTNPQYRCFKELTAWTVALLSSEEGLIPKTSALERLGLASPPLRPTVDEAAACFAEVVSAHREGDWCRERNDGFAAD